MSPESTTKENSPSDGNHAIEDDLSRLRIFHYTVESLAPLYRTIMRLFADGKARYQIHFRPDQVAAGLARRGVGLEVDDDTLERALNQLCDWGNLRRSHDTGRVATLEDFRRRHFLYQITTAGEAAERAVGAVVAALAESGALQTVMLGAILRNLGSLVEEMARTDDGPRPDRLYEGLFNVHEQFKALTENAGIFLARLHEAIDASEVRLDAFIAYKEAVITYLDDFVRQLQGISPRIVGALESLDATGVEDMMRLAAQADPTPTLDGQRDSTPQLLRQWQGIVTWFIGDTTQPATLKLLREAALHAVERILRVLSRLHEKRFRRANRTADLLRLATWFEDTTLVEDPHRLFQDAFGLFPARHLSTLPEDIDRVQPKSSWRQTPPVELSPTVRLPNAPSAPGRPPRISDHRAARRQLRQRHEAERRRDSEALARFIDRGPLRLAELPTLDAVELQLLLSLLGRLLASPADSDGRRQARSRDGQLRLALQTADDAAGDKDCREGPWVEVCSQWGRLTLPDFILTVERGLGQRRSGVGAA